MNYSISHRPIDNEDEPLFQFDLYERYQSDSAQFASVRPLHPEAPSPSHETRFVEGGSGRGPSHPLTGHDLKGKGPLSNPGPIQIPRAGKTLPLHFSRAGNSTLDQGSSSDCPPYSLPSSSTSASTSFGAFALETPSDHEEFLQSFVNLGFDYGSNEVRGLVLPPSSEGKGKGKAYIPPLNFSPSLFDGNHSRVFPTPEYLHTPSLQLTEPQTGFDTPAVQFPQPSPKLNSGSCVLISPPERPHSSACVPSFRKPPSRYAKGQGLLSRSFRDQSNETRSSSITPPGCNSGQHFVRLTCSTPVTPRSDSPAPHRITRFNSFPRPFSTFDLVVGASSDYFQPIPLVSFNHFEELLPRELQLKVLFSLVEAHEQDYSTLTSSRTWSCLKAAQHKHKWAGKNKAMRELVKFSRVSKNWRSLVYDGELWTDFDLPSLARVHNKSILAIAEVTGALMKKLSVPSQTDLRGFVLVGLVNSICVQPTQAQSLSYTQLTVVNLSCCRKLTTRSLHHLLLRCPSLRSLDVRGLIAVTNMTCALLGLHCPQLRSLNISRCPQLDGHCLRSITNTVCDNGEVLSLRRLVACGLRSINDEAMSKLGKVAPYLEILDLSYTRIHNSAIEAFVACEEDDATLQEVVSLTPRQAGREYGARDFYHRRVTHLRHLNLSYCSLLTDDACSNLAHTVPQLEFLELAGFGTGLKDDGLVHLLETTPLLRRLDIGGATSITDAVILTLTPPASDAESVPSAHHSLPTVPQLGTALEYLSISHANNVSNGALLPLIRRCKRLRVLEADDTRISSAVLKEFVDLVKRRRMLNAKLVVVDCRGVNEALVKQLMPTVRPRQGWRAYEARKLQFVDGRDNVVEDIKQCPDECDETRLVLKSFYSWQAVDAVAAARAEQRKRLTSSGDSSPKGPRWWSRSSSGSSSPTVFFDGDREGCVMM